MMTTTGARSSPSRRKASQWWLALPFALVIATTLLVTAPNGLYADGLTVTRLAALIGYQLIFWAVLSSAFTRPLVRAFGRPFVKLHHVVAVVGLAAIVLHPLLAVISWGDPTLLRPRFDSWSAFFQYGGSPALLLLLVAVIAGLLRRRFKSAWQVVHMLTYVAFLLGTLHATTAVFTTDLRVDGLRWVAWLLAAVAMVVFVLRRTAPAHRRRATNRQR